MSVFESLLNRTYAVSRRRRTPDAQGGWAIDYVAIPPIRGRLRPASSAERLIAQQEQRDLTHVFYCLEGEDIARGDRITGDGITVEVDAVREPSRADHHLEIDCMEKQFEQTLEAGS